MSAILLAAAALLANLAAPAFADAPLADPRLSDPETFKNFTDVSRPHPEGVAVPAWDGAPGARPLPRLTILAAPVRPAAIAVPTPATTGPRTAGGRRPVPRNALFGLMTAAMGILYWSSRKDAQQFPKGSVRVPTLPYPAETPLRLAFEPPSPQPASPPLWRAEPAPAPRPSAARPSLPWWAITNAEQEAINRWDVSPEKQFGDHPLEAWLDAHRSELTGVDVGRLTAKLRRDV